MSILPTDISTPDSVSHKALTVPSHVLVILVALHTFPASSCLWWFKDILYYYECWIM